MSIMLLYDAILIITYGSRNSDYLHEDILYSLVLMIFYIPSSLGRTTSMEHEYIEINIVAFYYFGFLIAF